MVINRAYRLPLQSRNTSPPALLYFVVRDHKRASL